MPFVQKIKPLSALMISYSKSDGAHNLSWVYSYVWTASAIERLKKNFRILKLAD